MANDDLIGDTKKSAKKTTPTTKTVKPVAKAAPTKPVKADVKATKPVAKAAPAKKAEAPVGRKPAIGDDTKFKSIKGAETREGSVWAAIHTAFQGGATVAEAAKLFKFKQPRGAKVSEDKKAFMRAHLKDAVKKNILAEV